MAISNGFDITRVLNAMLGRIGWQNATPVYPNGITSNAGISGRYFDDFHPLVSVSNLQNAIPNGNDMTSDRFNTWLGNLERSTVLSVLNGTFNQPQLVDNTLIYHRTLRYDNPMQNDGKMVGFRLYVANGNYAVQISQASFIFNGVCSFNCYLYQDMIKEPIYTARITTKANEEVVVQLPNWVINYVGSQNQGGVFYFGYDQNDIPDGIQALDQFVTRWNNSLAFGYTTFEADQTDDGFNFNRIAIPYSFRTYGMNLQIQSYKDYTDMIVKQPQLFDEVIGLSVAVKALGYLTYSVRSNQNERITKEMAQAVYNEVNNAGPNAVSPYIAGLKKEITREMGKLQQNFFPKLGIVYTRPPVFDDNGITRNFV